MWEFNVHPKAGRSQHHLTHNLKNKQLKQNLMVFNGELLIGMPSPENFAVTFDF